MVAASRISITLDIEPVVKLLCLNTECVFNLAERDIVCCNLKHVTLDFEGVCEQRQLRNGAKTEAANG
jgi:hypothetical protein